MQITQVQIGNFLYPLTEGQPLPIKTGEVIRVFFAFRGKVPERTEVRIWASVYHYVLDIMNRQEKAQTKGIMTLEATEELTDYETSMDITIGDIGSGLYGLIVELPDYDVSDKIDDCLEVAAVPGIFEMLGPLLMIGLMVGMVALISPMMEEGVG